MFAESPLSRLLAALSAALGQPIDVGGQDECVLEFEGPVEVVLAQAPDTQFLSLRSALTPSGAPGAAGPLSKALAINYTSMPPGCAIALDEAASQLVLFALVDADRTSPDELLSLLARFVALVPGLRDECEALAGSVEPDVPGMSGMLAVGAMP